MDSSLVAELQMSQLRAKQANIAEQHRELFALQSQFHIRRRTFYKTLKSLEGRQSDNMVILSNSDVASERKAPHNIRSHLALTRQTSNEEGLGELSNSETSEYYDTTVAWDDPPSMRFHFRQEEADQGSVLAIHEQFGEPELRSEIEGELRSLCLSSCISQSISDGSDHQECLALLQGRQPPQVTIIQEVLEEEDQLGEEIRKLEAPEISSSMPPSSSDSLTSKLPELLKKMIKLGTLREDSDQEALRSLIESVADQNGLMDIIEESHRDFLLGHQPADWIHEEHDD